MAITVVAFFTENGEPKTGLSPTIDIWTTAGVHTVTADSMVEIDGGFYSYSFAGYVSTTEYVIRADGGSLLSNAERYVYSTNEIETSDNDIRTTLGTPAVDVSSDIAAISTTIGVAGAGLTVLAQDLTVAKEATLGSPAVTVSDDIAAVKTVVDANAVLIVRALGLVQENFRLLSPVYDAALHLTSATLKIYPTAGDVDTDTNAIAEYSVTATYDVDGTCLTYKVKKV